MFFGNATKYKYWIYQNLLSLLCKATILIIIKISNKVSEVDKNMRLRLDYYLDLKNDKIADIADSEIIE